MTSKMTVMRGKHLRTHRDKNNQVFRERRQQIYESCHEETCLEGFEPAQTQLNQLSYRNDPKFSDRLVWANSDDPGQTAPRGTV